MNEQEIKELVERLRGIYPVGEYGIRKFETPIIQQEAVAAIEHLQAENKKLRKTIDGIISSEQERIDGMADDYAVLQAELRAKDERIKELEKWGRIAREEAEEINRGLDDYGHTVHGMIGHLATLEMLK